MPLLPITITGNLTKDPWLKKLQSGNCLGRMRVAASRRIRDENAPSGWRDLDNLFINVEYWGQLAVNVKKSLTKGMPVLVTGVLLTHEWTDEKGEMQQRIILRASQVGLDLARHVIGSKKSEPTEYNVDNIPLPDVEDRPELFDEIQAGTQEPAPSSFERGLARPVDTNLLGQQPTAPGQQPEEVGTSVTDATADGAAEGATADSDPASGEENAEAGREPVGAGAEQGGGPPF
ncbi:single-stranded DNA-binding protein [Corynebacterium halotolerans]|uniref:Single-stranded DNA-binding protein n=1 Tax=Corynebacterium halotolerans YIM 70093 = DSM 44683 TaxID=1121362 RepID=M1MZX1_9CORY|nr:single-stranded DNA-binding protein [Corynebacterium halotolerans]AGF73269.1 Single-stranded DNA-binding protein [Corynebacterium halotolerans YIM 70093 = DSM 44683]